MDPAPVMPQDVLIVEDDPIIALDFEDTILGFGVKAVRTAGNVARALDLIADRAPDFALLDVSLTREKSFAIAEQDSVTMPGVRRSRSGSTIRFILDAGRWCRSRSGGGSQARITWSWFSQTGRSL
jgi:hypothetical protein